MNQSMRQYTNYVNQSMISSPNFINEQSKWSNERPQPVQTQAYLLLQLFTYLPFPLQAKPMVLR